MPNVMNVGRSAKILQLSSIAIKTQPTKTVYKAGEIFNSAGMILTATYSDGTKQDISSGYTVPQTALTYGTSQITVSYTEYGITRSTTLAISISAPVSVGATQQTALLTSGATVRGIMKNSGYYQMVGTDASYNMYKMWFSANSPAADCHQAKANATGTYPASGIAYSGTFIGVPITTDYGGTIYKARYITAFESLSDFMSSATVSFKIFSTAGVSAQGVVKCDSNLVFLGRDSSNHAHISIMASANAVSNRITFSGLGGIVGGCYSGKLMFVTSDKKLCNATVGSTTAYSVALPSAITSYVCCCEVVGAQKMVVVGKTANGYGMCVYDAASNSAQETVTGIAATSDTIVGVETFADGTIIVVGHDSAGNGFIYAAQVQSLDHGQRYAASFANPEMICGIENGIGVLGTGSGKYTITELSAV